MANVQISINKSNGTAINVSGVVDDAALAPFTDQLAVMLATAANAPVIPPLPPTPEPAPAITPQPTTTTTTTP